MLFVEQLDQAERIKGPPRLTRRHPQPDHENVWRILPNQCCCRINFAGYLYLITLGAQVLNRPL